MTLSKDMAGILNTVIDRSLEDQITETGTIAPIDIYPDDQDDKLWDIITENAEASGDQIFDEIFSEQRGKASQLIYDTLRDIATNEIGNADVMLDIKVEDDDIDEIMMMMLDPAFTQIDEENKEPVPTPTPNIEEMGNG